MTDTIAFNRPYRSGREAEYITQAIASDHWRGDGPFTRTATRLLSDRLGGAAVLLTTSCTHALELAALLLQIGPGDEVIVPSFTFVSTASAFALRGARVVFADIDPATLNLDPASVATRITARTKAMVPVHYAGVACDLDALVQLGVPLIEDNAHGLFGRWRGRPLGTFGALATQSFHDTKNIGCGEGGALVCNEAVHLERAEILREKGTNRARFFRGQIDKYTWVDVGSSFLPSDLLAAVLAAQLDDADAIQAARHAVWNRYHHELASWCLTHGIARPHVPVGAEHPAHIYWLRVRDLSTRTRLLAHLAAHRITATFHYQPLHLSEVGRRAGGAVGDCPVTEAVADTMLRLPLFASLTSSEVDRIIAAVVEFSP